MGLRKAQTCSQCVGEWFRNIKKRENVGYNPLEKYLSYTFSDDESDHDEPTEPETLDTAHELTALNKRMCARKPAAMELWASEHPDKVPEYPSGSNVGEQKAIRAAAFREQSDAVKEEYAQKASALGDRLQSDPASIWK